jgi:cysteine desulfurase
MIVKLSINWVPLFRSQLLFSPFTAGKVIYMDYQATTPIDYRVMDTMMPYMLKSYGNPHSKTHQFGWDTSKGV